MANQSSLTVCYFGTYRNEYSRNIMMIDGLRINGVRVLECHQQLWHGLDDRIQITRGGWFSVKFILRLISAYVQLIIQFIKLPNFDLLVVGYPGQADVYLAKFLAFFRRKPLVWDVFMSIYLIALERDLDKESKLTVSMLKWLEKWALRLPDILIQDTEEYVNWLVKTHNADRSKFRLVPTGADDRVYISGNVETITKELRVTYHGTFIANHGTQYIVEAARQLKDNNEILFVMIGSGPEREDAVDYCKKHNLENVTFIDWLEKSELVVELRKSDILLGAFGKTPQSVMTVQNKIFEGLSLHKPVVTGDSITVRKHLEDKKHVYLCRRESAQAIREAILALYSDHQLRDNIAEEGHKIFNEEFSISKIGQKFKMYLTAI